MAIRIPYDSLTLRAVADELERLLPGGQVQHIAQPAATDLVLTVRGRGANHMLLLSCDSGFARALLTVQKRPNPASPPAFCMLCRKYLEDGFVVSVAQRGFDRILDLEIESGAGRFRLVAELMGKHSNVILVNEQGTVLDAAKRITRRLSRFREVLPGVPYAAPPSQEDREDPFAAGAAAFAAVLDEPGGDLEARSARLMGHFAGLSPFLAEEVALRAEQGPAAEAWDELFGAAARGAWTPVVIRGEQGEPIGAYPFPTVQAPGDRQNERTSICTALDHYYGVAMPRAAREGVAHELETFLDRAIRTREKQRESLERTVQEAGRAEEHRRVGELLLANLHAIEPGATSATVTDYYAPDAPERVITLDPQKSGRENAEAYFRRYHKAKDGLEAQRGQLTRTEDDLRRLRAAQTRVREAKDLEALRTLRGELTATGLLRLEPAAGSEEAAAARGRDFQGRKIRVIHTPEGWDIYLGENSEANDYLTSRVAAPNDLWLHVRANTSAHVVIPTRNSPSSVPHTVLMRAALLAAQHSPSKHSSMVPVDYTLRKYVRRPRGAAPGTVLYQNEKTLYVTPQENGR